MRPFINRHLWRAGFLALLLCTVVQGSGCRKPKHEQVFESQASARFPGQQLKIEDRSYVDSTVVEVGDLNVLLVFEWNVFYEPTYHCLKVGDIKVFKEAYSKVILENFEMTPLPCAVDWFTDDTVIYEKMLMGATIEISSNGKQHRFEGAFCTIDGKGKLNGLQDQAR